MNNPSLGLKQKSQNYQLLQGRLTAAKWISMREPEVGREIAELEKDSMFQDLLYGAPGLNPIVKRMRWPASSIHSGFYELNDGIVAASGESDIQDILHAKEELIEVIRGIGIEAFEKYFLYGEEGLPLAHACRELALSEEQGRAIMDLVLKVGTRSEFFRPTLSAETSGIRYHCIASIEKDIREPDNLFFRFLSPHWARGKYVIAYERLEEWKSERAGDTAQRRRLRKLLKRVELLNMRQDTLFQILSRATNAQSSFLRSRMKARRRPLSLRELARRIGVAPSTVSRSIANRSVELPWSEEVPIKELLSGQRVVVLSILQDWHDAGGLGKGVTDEMLMRRLAEETGINVSRRTINDCRRKLPHSGP
ncbi:MAG: hypothetical protein ABIJ96_10585 [Elusimicrobiota bacterium]